MNLLTYSLIATTAAVFIFHTYLRYKDSLQMFQQNVYDSKRYIDWIVRHTEKSLPFLDILPLILWLGLYIFPSINMVIVLLSGSSVFYLVQSYLLYKKSKGFVKKPLVMTPRVWRMVGTSLILFLILAHSASLIAVQTEMKYWFLIYVYALLNITIYGLVLLANLINKPIEHHIRKQFVEEAKQKIDAAKMTTDVVAITGSYGKTTTKHIITHILNEEKYALMTPSSYNTPMGITITIRESLKPIHDVFVCEMGAYKRGEIKELADIVKPKYGVVTAIGPQHLNTFKTIENIQKTKFELVEALPQDGLAVINIDDALIKSYVIKNNCAQVTYGISNDKADYYAFDIKYHQSGMAFSLILPKDDKKTVHIFKTSLLGEHNIQNILASIAIADDMQIPIEKIIKGVLTLPQVEHRLEIKKAGQFTIIDDAFNANPVGTQKAIDVLAKMPGKKIVITPGMVELGTEQEKLNEAYGFYMSDKVDMVILIGKKQTEPIYRGLLAKMPAESIFVATNLQEGFSRMYLEAIPGSFVLIANDLPDTYNE
ncbi:MAG: Mur ligase family protein [Culicoidibacterales bacterium]